MTVTLKLTGKLESELSAWAKRTKRDLTDESAVSVALENLITIALANDARDWDEAIEAINRGLQAEREGGFTPFA